MLTCWFLLILIHQCTSQISWTTSNSLPSVIDTEDEAINIASGVVDDTLYIFFKDSAVDSNKIYRINFSQPNPNWIEINANNNPPYDILCDYAKCSTTIQNRYIYIHLLDDNIYINERKSYFYIFDTMIEQWLSSPINVPNDANSACLTSDKSNNLYIIGGNKG
eukprot:194000_1